MTLYTEEGIAEEMVTVPNFTGYSVSAVEQMANALGLNLRKEGNISASDVIATDQSLEQGTSVAVGTVVTVTFHTANATVE